MKVKTTYEKDAYEDEVTHLSIKINNKRHFSIGRGEPEDMTLYRNLSDAYNVVDMMRLAYEAGKAGETFETEEETEES
jgi:hypothetical protein